MGPQNKTLKTLWTAASNSFFLTAAASTLQLVDALIDEDHVLLGVRIELRELVGSHEGPDGELEGGQLG
jgi:hypothetical protein